MSEPASVVAARQLAEEAREWSPRPPRPVRRRRVLAGLLTGGLGATAGCGAGVGVDCPAMAYGSALTVQLDHAWPTGAARTVEVDCGDLCGGMPTSAAVDAAGAAEVGLVLSPDPVTIRVLDGGVVVAEDVVSPDWVRVGGSEECGGPTEAGVVVAPPD